MELAREGMSSSQWPCSGGPASSGRATGGTLGRVPGPKGGTDCLPRSAAGYGCGTDVHEAPDHVGYSLAVYPIEWGGGLFGGAPQSCWGMFLAVGTVGWSHLPVTSSSGEHWGPDCLPLTGFVPPSKEQHPGQDAGAASLRQVGPSRAQALPLSVTFIQHLVPWTWTEPLEGSFTGDSGW